VLIASFSAVAVMATVYTLTMPFFERDRLATRIKAVAVERERIRARERARLAAEVQRTALRREPKAYMARLVDRFNLKKALVDEGTVNSLKMAGYRGQ